MRRFIICIGFLMFSVASFANNSIEYHNSVTSDTGEVAKAHALHKKVVDEGRYISSIDEALAVTLPQGIKKKIGNQDFILVIESMSYAPDGAKLTVYMLLDIPRSDQKLALRGKDISFCPGGFTGSSRLELMEDVNVPLGKNMNMIIKGGNETSKTFVECDCKGYKSMGLQGEIQFSREKLIPEGPDGKIITNPNAKVTAPFETQLVGWDDLLIELGISPFQVKDAKDFSFKVTSAVFDFSEAANSPAMVFPDAYESSDFTDGDQKMWKGFFLKDIVVKLPGSFSKDTLQRSSIEAHNMLIDHIGLSGKFSAKNILPLNEGNASGWAFSVNEISAELMKNELASCGFKGEIVVPPLGDTTKLAYNAFIDPAGQYTFIVKTTDTIQMDIWKADLRLDPNSFIDISVINGKFRPKAVLNGALTVKTEETEIAGVTFEELAITPEAPFLKAKAFSFGMPGVQQKLGNFPISISNIGMVNTNNRTGLKFDLKLNLVGESSGGFSGETGLTLFAKNVSEANRQRWRYDGLEVSKIAIDIDGGAYKLAGSAEWYKNDQIYGNGFSGNIDADFKGLTKVTATALFGNINGMRYFYADAMVSLKNGVPIFTGFNLYGIGGGIYHHMNQLGWDEKAIGTIGKTASGIVYKPDEKIFLGFKASVNVGLTTKSIFNSDVTFEMAFNKNAGVDRIIFRGNGYFMTPPEEGGAALTKIKEKAKDIGAGKDPNSSDKKESAKSSLYAFVNLDFDFRNDVMHGNLGTYINLPGGVLQGIGPGGKAGEAVMHFAKDEWYIHIGTPDNRIGITALRFAELNAYFMTGTKIYESPPPPENVSRILGNYNLDYTSSLNALGEGKGIAFGAGLRFNTGNKKFGPFYAKFDAGAGFDVMLKNYGQIGCKNQSTPLGINGWYANGQVWAYLEGSIGVEVDWRFIHGKYEILQVGAAAVLQAKLPNPFWMRGVIGGHYSILGGLVSGNCRFDFTVGEECEVISGGSPVKGMAVITEATPNDGSTDINVFNSPQAVFSMPIGKVFQLQDMDGNNISFKVELDHFKILNDGKEIKGSLEWNAEKDVVAFNSFEILPSEKKLKLEVQVSFRESKNGTWQTIMESGKKLTEVLVTNFSTGKAPENIPLNNVAYSYPMPMMFNYYQNETDLGYIQLKQGQQYLFNPGPEWKQLGRFVDRQGQKHEFEFSYSVAEKKIEFKRPANLKNNTIYSFELVNTPTQAVNQVDKNIVSTKKKTMIAEDNESTVEFSSKKAEGTLEILEDKNIFETFFRTSRFNTLNDKISNLNMNAGSQWPLRPLVHLIYKGIDGGECFDKFEAEGNESIAPTIRFTNVLDNKPWFHTYIYPYLYENYPLDGSIKIKERQQNPVGLPPTHTINIAMGKTIKNLAEQDIQYNSFDADIGPAAFHSYLVHYSAIDYNDLATQVCSKYWNVPNIDSRLVYLIVTPFQVVRRGDYNFNIEYVLPGLNQVSSSKAMTITINY